MLCERHANSSGDVEIVQEAFDSIVSTSISYFFLINQLFTLTYVFNAIWSELQDHSGVRKWFEKC